eukprot:m.42570 g.42570  ORF g.42570 m.42570 type:complete len:484 (-) comp12893_c0_seq2:104-1555(-)
MASEDVFADVCRACRLRYIKATERTDFNPAKMALSHEDSMQAPGQMDSNNGPLPYVCSLCEGILPALLDIDTVSAIATLIPPFDSKTLTLGIVLPSSVALNERSFQLYLSTQEPSDYATKPVVDVKDTAKLLLQQQLAPLVPYKLTTDSTLKATFTWCHDHTEDRCHVLEQLQPREFQARRQAKSKAKRAIVTSDIQRVFDKTDEETLRKYLKLPPPPPSQPAKQPEVEFYRASAYIGGRYNKYARDVPQSPWFIDGERKGRSSVEEVIREPLLALTNSRKANLISAGREDIDVRMLGQGRPFAMEMEVPLTATVTQAQLDDIQTAINAAQPDVQVRDLTLITSIEAVDALKASAESKRKSYSCPIWCSSLLTDEAIATFNQLGEVTIAQKTPVRVLHRRSLANRPRTIYSLKLSALDTPHFYMLELITQSGTYIKEFVHGDYGRTRPSVGDLLQCQADIVALDVMDVDFAWPPKENTNELEM